MKPFIILALPRSMTAWVANWFTQCNCICYHEGTPSYGSLDDLLNYNRFNPGEIYADCSSGLPVTSPDDVIRLKDQFRIGYIRRDFDECVASYEKVNPDPELISSLNVVTQVNISLKKILSSVDFTEIDYNNLFDEGQFREFHETLTPSIPFCSTRYKILQDLSVTQKVKEVYERTKSWAQEQ